MSLEDISPNRSRDSLRKIAPQLHKGMGETKIHLRGDIDSVSQRNEGGMFGDEIKLRSLQREGQMPRRAGHKSTGLTGFEV